MLSIYLGLVFLQITERPRNSTNMAAQQQETDLTRQLRRFSAQNVKIDEGERSWARQMIDRFVKDFIYRRINSSDLPVLEFEYTGSLYERLKTTRADEADIMIVLQVGGSGISATKEVPGYYRLQVNERPLLKFADTERNVLPAKIRSWFIGLVTKAVNEIRNQNLAPGVHLIVRAHGPAIQLDIMEGNRELSIDLVPAFRFSAADEHLVAKSVPMVTRSKLSCSPEILWRQSFSVKEKNILANMDSRDSGCRHELLRIFKTVISRDPGTFGRLTSYHLKTAFLRYMDSLPSGGEPWHRNKLGERYMGFVRFLQAALNSKILRHYWVQKINLLEEIDVITLNNMQYRLLRFINSPQERSAVLCN